MDYQKVIELLKKTNRSNDMVCILPKSDISKVIISAMQELQELYSIGTAEELLEAVEKQKAKKPLLGGNADKLTGDIRICPCCCGIVGMDDMRADYCADCGQHIDWSEVEE